MVRAGQIDAGIRERTVFVAIQARDAARVRVPRQQQVEVAVAVAVRPFRGAAPHAREPGRRLDEHAVPVVAVHQRGEAGKGVTRQQGVEVAVVVEVGPRRRAPDDAGEFRAEIAERESAVVAVDVSGRPADE